MSNYLIRVFFSIISLFDECDRQAEILFSVNFLGSCVDFMVIED
ncbi:hypothetical protein [Aphanizomenon flos-aquae]|nr:hypothetical protein [Aphanizomenon flos-aquae]